MSPDIANFGLIRPPFVYLGSVGLGAIKRAVRRWL